MGVSNQPKPIELSTRQRILVLPVKTPIPTIAPITACELETGTSGMVGKPCPFKKLSKPCEANRKSTMECAVTTTQAETGDSDTISCPIVIMTFFEKVKMPIAIAIAPSKNSC